MTTGEIIARLLGISEEVHASPKQKTLWHIENLIAELRYDQAYENTKADPAPPPKFKVGDRVWFMAQGKYEEGQVVEFDASGLLTVREENGFCWQFTPVAHDRVHHWHEPAVPIQAPNPNVFTPGETVYWWGDDGCLRRGKITLVKWEGPRQVSVSVGRDGSDYSGDPAALSHNPF